jgi:hypothetical protein
MASDRRWCATRNKFGDIAEEQSAALLTMTPSGKCIACVTIDSQIADGNAIIDSCCETGLKTATFASPGMAKVIVVSSFLNVPPKHNAPEGGIMGNSYC